METESPSEKQANVYQIALLNGSACAFDTMPLCAKTCDMVYIFPCSKSQYLYPGVSYNVCANDQYILSKNKKYPGNRFHA